jgi:hypothetical protein
MKLKKNFIYPLAALSVIHSVILPPSNELPWKEKKKKTQTNDTFDCLDATNRPYIFCAPNH